MSAELFNDPSHDADASPAESKVQYVVIARRYRPQSFDELVGQQHVARALASAIESNRVGHAYLFSGPRGVGKTSAARILAKALNCTHGSTPSPCNHCDICDSISTGDDVDVLEIDGASNRGIDEIRQLRQNVILRPTRSRFKVYIIDEVHMLTTPAFNALLKTLEEPPRHVKFVFCTTEPEKIPITIHSRCQRFDFAGISASSIVERLRQIAAAEGVEADAEALSILARRAAGSMRDSQSLLEQLLAFGPGRIGPGDVHAMLGTADDRLVSQLLMATVKRDAATALGLLDTALGSGVEASQLLGQLLGSFRDLMVTAAGCSGEVLLHTASMDREAIVAAAEKLGLETILAAMQILDRALERLRYATQGRTVAELAVVRLCHLADLEEIGALVAQLRQDGAPGSVRLPSGQTGSAVDAVRAKASSEVSVPKVVGPPAANAPGSATGAVEAKVDGASGQTTNGPAATRPPLVLTPETAQEVWQQALGRLTGLLAEQASMCASVALVEPARLVVAFRPKYDSCKVFCERPDKVALFEEALAKLAGTPVHVEFAIVDDQADAPSSQAAQTAKGPQTRRRRASDHPMVNRTIELFDAEVLWDK